MFRVDGSVKAVIGDLEDPKFIWELLEQRYVAKRGIAVHPADGAPTEEMGGREGV